MESYLLRSFLTSAIISSLSFILDFWCFRSQWFHIKFMKYSASCPQLSTMASWAAWGSFASFKSAIWMFLILTLVYWSSCSPHCLLYNWMFWINISSYSFKLNSNFCVDAFSAPLGNNIWLKDFSSKVMGSKLPYLI